MIGRQYLHGGLFVLLFMGRIFVALRLPGGVQIGDQVRGGDDGAAACLMEVLQCLVECAAERETGARFMVEAPDLVDVVVAVHRPT